MLKQVLPRNLAFIACILILLLALANAPGSAFWQAVAIVFGALTVIGIMDLMQTEHAVLRNYPVIGHIRWMVETVRPELRQYLLENENEAVPFSRAQRSIVYRRAKGEPSEQPFGTLTDVYAEGYEFIQHSSRPVSSPDPANFRITVGNDQCSQPYSASIFNISAMSFGALSPNAVRALNKGAALGQFYHDTGEGSISSYHRENGGDLVWQIASGYYGCRTPDGFFDPDKFATQAVDPQVRMIEIKLSQGAKPGHGGILPSRKLTAEIALTRGVPMGQDCISPPNHSAFSTPMEMMAFVAELRRLSGGKPVGFKLCIGHGWEFMAIVKAMQESGTIPDFVVIDGGEGGTGAAPAEFTDHIGTPMREGLLFAHNTLVGAGLRDKVKIGAAGRVISAFDIARTMALGADWCNAARGYMFALGCIQSLHCHTNLCPTGLATQDKVRQRALVVPDKSERVHRYHDRTVHVLAEMLAAAGLSHPDQLRPQHLARRVSPVEIRTFDRVFDYLAPGELMSGDCRFEYYRDQWRMAHPDSFDPI